MKPERIKEYEDKMDACKEEDTETGHIEADDLLIGFIKELGYSELAMKYDSVRKWYA